MTNAPQELVQSDKKAELILEDGRFATIYKVKLGHILRAQDSDPMHFSVKLIAQCVRVDDKPLGFEEIVNFDLQDYHKIMHHLATNK